MATTAEDVLAGSIDDNVSLKLIEPGIYSVSSDVDISNSYDTEFGWIYDWVACNPLYNRIVWGYSTEKFASLVGDALVSPSQKGSVLDLGCGSLAFTAKTYVQYPERPVLLIDQSIRMLRIAKSRLINLNGDVPRNMVFLHADALHLPFRPKSFGTIISQNLLHCIDGIGQLLAGLRNVLSEDGRMYFTTLVRNNRLADRYLEALAAKGKLVSRNIEGHKAVFQDLGMSAKYCLNGNMAFIDCGDQM